MSQAYTVFFNDSSGAQRGLSAHDAAVEMLTDDGHDYEIRAEPDGVGFRLWTCQPVANRPWIETVIFSLEADEAVATTAIMQRVVEFTGRTGSWAGECMTDAAFDAMIAEADEE